MQDPETKEVWDSAPEDGEAGDDEDGAHEEEEQQQQQRGAQAMADAMAHVLAKKPKKTGAPILSGSKSAAAKLKQEREERRQKKLEKEAKAALIDRCRLQPGEYPVENEKKLVRMATKGMRKQQKESEEPEVAKSAAGGVQGLSKTAFLDMLKGAGKDAGTETRKHKAGAKEEEEEAGAGAGWDVLRADYMMGSSMKKWRSDKEDGADGGGKGVPEDVSDLDSEEEMFEGESEAEMEEEFEDD